MTRSDRLSASLADWAYEAAPTALAVADRSGELTTCNPAFAALCGDPDHTLIGQEIWQTLGSSARTPLLAAFREAVTTGASQVVVLVKGETGPQQWHFRLEVDGRTEEVRLMGDDRTRENRLSAQAKQAATRDRLTGLENRDAFLDELDEVLHSGQSVAVYVVDIDRFALLNDTYGHEFGDTVLIMLGRRLSQLAGVRNRVARIGGDQFAVMMRRIDDAGDVEAGAARLHEGLTGEMAIDRTSVHLRLSIGFTFNDGGGVPAVDLLRDADSALSRAEDLGGNRIQRFHPEFQEEIERRILTEADLRRAVGTPQLDADVQAIYRSDGVEPAGFEGLARWRHPDRGTVPPNQFIEVAERFNLLDHVLTAVLDRSLRTLTPWMEGHPSRYLAVNVAPSQLRDADPVPLVAAAVDIWGIEPRQLVVELTERELVADPESIRSVERLSELGVRVAIDDFGAGASSLGYLWGLPVSILKLDRSLTNSLVVDPGARRVVRSLINLAGDLGLEVVAEGVETEEVLHGLRQLGCGFVQGFLLHRPCPLDRVDGLLHGVDRVDGQLHGVDRVDGQLDRVDRVDGQLDRVDRLDSAP